MFGSLSTPISDALALFELDNRARRFSPRTHQFYRFHLTPFAAWCAGHNAATVDAVTPALIRGYLVHLQDPDRGLADNTIHGSARAIKTFFNFCVREELIERSPMRKVTMPKVGKVILPAFTVDDARRLLAACETIRDRAAILFLLDTGLRASEFINLDGQDVDLHLGSVRVRRGKGDKDRMVYLGAHAAKALARYYLRVGKPGKDEPVWRGEKGGYRLTTAGLRHLLRRVGVRAKVDHCSPHTFRRTFALWSLRAGMSIYHLQRLMGHEDITTLRRYLALAEYDLQDAHARHGAVDSILNNREDQKR